MADSFKTTVNSKCWSITTKFAKFTLSPCSTMLTLRVCYNKRIQKLLVINNIDVTLDQQQILTDHKTSSTKLLLGAPCES